MLKKWFNRKTSQTQIKQMAELEQKIAKLHNENELAKKEIAKIEHQRDIFIQQRDEYKQETKRLYQVHQAIQDEINEVAYQRDVFISQRDELEKELKLVYAGHKAMEDEINFLKFRNEQTSELHERIVLENWVGDKSKQEYYCKYPFERIEILPRGEVYTCCSGYLKSGYDIGNIFEQDFDEVWNSDKAKKLRYSVCKGNFEYCYELCMHLANKGKIYDIENPVQKKMDKVFPYKNYDECEMQKGPKMIALSFDESCNLQCPSCRNQLKVVGEEVSDRLYNVLDKKIRPLLNDCELFSLLGSGDVFASRACIKFLKTISYAQYPNMELYLITNAQLLTPKRWEEYAHLLDFPMQLAISVDAAEKETYEKLRKGGKWDILCSNLEYIKELFSGKQDKKLILNFVIQKDNYKQMKDFVEFARKYGANYIRFQYMTNWGTMEDAMYKEMNVMHPENPLYDEAVKILNEIEESEKEITILKNIPTIK